VLTKPGIPDETIVKCATESFGLRISNAIFLPIGADVNNAVYRLTTHDAARYLLKLRRGTFDEIAVRLPAYLHARGISRVMAPLATPTKALWANAHGFAWVLYPFFEGKTGFEVSLSATQWIALGETIRAVQSESLQVELLSRLPRESYSARDRTIVKRLDAELEQRSFGDSVAARFADLWTAKRDDVRTIVGRAEQLASEMEQGHGEFVLCHSDLHARNVLLRGEDELVIIDWDEPILAPKERDLMFVGGGVGGIWNDPSEAGRFYKGYGPAEIDAVALAYYRYERIVLLPMAGSLRPSRTASGLTWKPPSRRGKQLAMS
jgi:spectinomycin phosphotransferase